MSSETIDLSRCGNTSLKYGERGTGGFTSIKISFKNKGEIHFQIKDN